MTRANLRIAAEFDAKAEAYNGHGLTSAIIIDDNANLLHRVEIEYAEENGLLYRRMTYVLYAMQTMKEVIKVQNDAAEQLLYKFGVALAGSSLGPGRAFDTKMFQAGRDDDNNPLAWDDTMPGDVIDESPTPRKKGRPKKEASNE